MATEIAGNILANRLAELKQKQGSFDTARIIELPAVERIIIKPRSSSWEELELKLRKVVNFAGLMKTARELYDQGYGAELETAMEIATAKARKSPLCMFAAMISKKAGNWESVTLKMVRDTWEVRRNTLEVMDKLKLKAESTKAILAMAWRLKGSIIRFLGIATEQGTGINNPAGVFFALTKKTT